MATLKNLFFLLFIFREAEGFLSQVETNIFLALLKQNFFKNCLLVPREVSHTKAAKMVKTLSNDRVFATFLKRENLRKYLEKADEEVYHWTAIVLKEESLNSTDYFNNPAVISSYLWLLFDGSKGTLRDELILQEIPFDTALLLMEKIRNEHYLISEYYTIKKQDPGVLRPFGDWKNGCLNTTQVEWYDRKSNMNKYEFTTVKFNERLYLTPKEKINEIVWEELSQLLNFTIKAKLIQYSNGFQELDPDEDEAFLDTKIYIGGDEKMKVHILGPTFQSGLYMYVKAAGEDKGLSRFLKPFSKDTWHNIGYWIVYCGLFCLLVESFSRKFGCSKKPRVDYVENIFAPAYSLCNQCGLEVRDNISSRGLILVVRTSAVVIYYAYSAIFISCLLLYIPRIPFTDLNGFIEDGTYKIAAERNSEVDVFFNISEVPSERLVYQKFLVNVAEWSRLDKEIDRLCEGEKLVLVAYDDDIDKYRPCDILKIRKPLKVLTYGFKIRYRSPFRGILHVKLLLLRTTGILQRVNNEIIQKRINKFNQNEKYEINVEKVSAVFTILFYGCAISLGILVLELIFSRLSGFHQSNLEKSGTKCRRTIAEQF